MTSPVMTAEEAAWVREHAWLPPMRRDYAQWPVLYDRGPCRRFLAGGGACGACQAGDHDDCARRMEGWPADAPLCWVTDTQGRVPVLDGVDSVRGAHWDMLWIDLPKQLQHAAGVQVAVQDVPALTKFTTLSSGRLPAATGEVALDPLPPALQRRRSTN